MRHWLALSTILLLPALSHAQDEAAETTWDGLVVVEDAELAAAYINPSADFSVFQRVAILEPLVAFRSNWQRDQNRSRSRNIRASDIERIKEDVAALFKTEFEERLEAAGYDIVNIADDDVLILRPAIIDLDIAAAEVRGDSGRSRTYTTSASAATLYIELFDSLSNDLLGRAIDRRAAGRGGFATRSNRVTNRADARRVFAVWADTLIEFLDAHYVKGEASE